MRLDTLLSGFADAVPALAVSGVAFDSRALAPGELFLATRGLRHHGLAFAARAEAAGAAAIAWEPPFDGVLPELAIPLLRVPELGRHASRIAGRACGEPSHALEVVGITGTDGKTSTAHFLAQALDEPGRRAGILGTVGYGVFGEAVPASHTTPDAVAVQRLLAELRARGARAVAMEVSSHALVQHRVEALRFACAVFTNLTRDHLDFHGTVDAYGDAKARLFTALDIGAAVLNLDDAFGADLVARTRAPVFGYGLGAREAAGLAGFTWGEGLSLSLEGLRLTVQTHAGCGELHAPLLGRFNAANLLAALATLLALGCPLAEALARLSRVDTVPGRMERFGGAGLPLAVVDYAHTPFALESVLRALRAHLPAGGKLSCVFGCGGERDRGKRPQMGAVAERFAERVVVTNDNPRGEDPNAIISDILAGFARPAAATVEPERRAAIRAALAGAGPADIVLIAGKGHEDYQLIGGHRLDFSDRAEAAGWFAERTR